MSVFSIAYRGTTAAALIAGAALLCGFTFRPGGPPELHYREYNAQPPRGNTVSVCHAHGCQLQESFTFTRADISDLSVLMEYVRGADTPAQERRAIAYAIGWMERRAGPATGTANDRAGLSFMNTPGQLDCVDEATNTTSYLLVLAGNGLLRHHTVIRPFSKASFFKWPHFSAMIKERRSGRVYAVDSFFGPNGANPAIQLASKWYINDEQTAPAPVPEQPPMAEYRNDNIGRLVEQILRDNPDRP
ncbi:MAG: hypothetical protein IIB62_02380 [Proteobacteria bacterium]|nr:hypothetical protein [Pseudomonadota bacterium]